MTLPSQYNQLAHNAMRGDPTCTNDPAQLENEIPNMTHKVVSALERLVGSTTLLEERLANYRRKELIAKKAEDAPTDPSNMPLTTYGATLAAMLRVITALDESIVSLRAELEL